MMSNRSPIHRLGISSRLFLSFVVVLFIALVVAFAASEALAPAMIARHTDHMRRGPGGPMREHAPGMLPDETIARLDAEYQRATQQAVALGLITALAVAGAASLVFSRRITAPLRRMHEASARIAEGHYEERLREDAPGEVGELAAAFNRMVAELENTEARRSSLIATVAHEFRTPLTALQGYIEGLADGHFTATPETIEACTGRIARLRRLVDDLSLLSRVEAGVESVEPRPCALHPLLEQARSALQTRFDEKGVALHVDADQRGTHVFADRERTVAVIENLLTNALRHTPAGGMVSISTDLPRDARNAGVSIRVTDTGEGISPEALPHVFERFYRADTARRREDRGDGTGIGLTLAKAFIEAQGGSIEVESRVGVGTTVTVSLRAGQLPAASRT